MYSSILLHKKPLSSKKKLASVVYNSCVRGIPRYGQGPDWTHRESKFLRSIFFGEKAFLLSLGERMAITAKSIPLHYFEFNMLLKSEIPSKFAERANRSSMIKHIFFDGCGYPPSSSTI
jgi:hypothetical protein